MLGRFVVALGPTLLIVVASVLFIPHTAAVLLVAGGSLALLLSAMTRRHVHAFIGGLAIAFPLAVVAIIAFARACDAGERFCR